MIATVAAGILAAILGSCAPACAPTSPAPAPALAPCPGDVVTVTGDASPGCDVSPPQRLDVLDVTGAQCDHMGGTYDATARTCAGVDY